MSKIKPIAFILPQFHPVPENDVWWGKGFTEWTNVTKAKPLFDGHYQPHLPADLGFYDLRLPEARQAQADLAKAYGIYGFCYYHYWFNGKRILERPIDEVLKSGQPDFPFMLCWANENWTRTWDGGNDHVLLEQNYSEADDLAHILHLITYFKDNRYIKVDGKPVFVIYRPKFFPDIKKTIALWSEETKKAGFPDLHIGFSQNFEHQFEPSSQGFDFAFEFQPNFIDAYKVEIKLKTLPNETLKHRVLNTLGLKAERNENRLPDNYTLCDYEAYSKLQMTKGFNPNVYPGITPMWDNSARKKINPFILNNSTPEKYGSWLQYIKHHYPWDDSKANFLFINAWNEWAEGNHLEPCQKWKTAYLEVTRAILK